MAEAISSSSSSRTSTPPPPSVSMDTEACTSDNVTPPEGSQPGKDCGDTGMAGATGLENKIDKLLEKQKNELMYELRRLQHGDRPVTGQGHKEAVEEFFQRASQPEPAAENRPENVVVEVNALVERRPVSSMLNSVRFRRSLETALRGALTSVSSRPPSLRRSVLTSNAQTSVAAPPPPSPPAYFSDAVQSQQSAENTLPETSSLRRGGEHVVSPQNVTPESVLHRGPPRNEPAVQVPGTVPTASNRPNQDRVAHAQQWVQQIEQPHDQSDRVDVNVWDRLEEGQRDEFINEISDLVQRQLVTSTVGGNFGNTLNNVMRNRLVQTGTLAGRRVQQVLRSLPRSHHIRNDFSDLGIMAPGEQDVLSDEVSVISATAAVAVPYAQSNAALSRELHSLKSQMKEMMNMMKLNFDLTLDLQRSVRQEVSAAMNNSNEGNIGATGTTTRSVPVDDTTCLICTETQVDTVLYQCGHMCVCHSCGIQLRQRGAHCPVCRAPIRDIIRAYKCNSE